MTTDLVTVAAFQQLLDAELCKLRLEMEGLTVFLADAETVNMDWFLANAIGRIKLQVPGPEVEAAGAILEEIRKERRERDKPTNDAKAEVCLACGAPFRADATRCSACGWSFDETKET